VYRESRRLTAARRPAIQADTQLFQEEDDDDEQDAAAAAAARKAKKKEKPVYLKVTSKRDPIQPPWDATKRFHRRLCELGLGPSSPHA
jgi:hypothetical protein